MSVFEIVMLLSFGAAWPFSIYKSYRSKSTRGKSIVFLMIVLIGYIAGILHKYLYHFDMVVVFYFLNLTLVMLDCVLFFWNKNWERKNKNKECEPQNE